MNKKLLAKILNIYGEKFHELKIFLNAWKKREKKQDDFFKLKIPPTRLYIEPTNACNRNCKYCARRSMTREISFLSFSAFKKIVKDLPRGLHISMLGNGEPMLNPKIYDMIKYATDRGFITAIITNGTALTEENSRKLIESGINRVQISFDSVVKSVFNDSYNFPTDNLGFEKSFKKIIDFIFIARKEYKKESPFITIAVVMTKEVKSINSINKKFWEKMPIDNYFEGGLLTLQSDSALYKPKDLTKENEWKICANPFTSLKINSDGTVNPCIQDFSSKYIVGNTNEKPLREIYNSKEAIDLRKALYNKDLKFLSKIGYSCHQCNAWTNAIKHDIEGYLCNSFPITYGLMIKEIDKNRIADPEKIKNIEYLKENFSYKTIADFAEVKEEIIKGE